VVSTLHIGLLLRLQCRGRQLTGPSGVCPANACFRPGLGVHGELAGHLKTEMPFSLILPSPFSLLSL
jgi:hypothetical protein